MNVNNEIRSGLLILASALYALVMTTGVLTLAVVTASAFTGEPLAELYYRALPHSTRGGSAAAAPVAAYAIFHGYVASTAIAAVLFRRRLARRVSSRRHPSSASSSR